MNIKKDKGITLITLIITVILLAIIASAAVSLGVNITGSARFENVETNLLLIQSKCKVLADQKYIGEITEEDLYGTKQTEGEYNGWYLLSQQDLNSMGLDDLKAEDNYYVDYENDDVAYGIGVGFDGNTFYKLSDILDYTEE